MQLAKGTNQDLRLFCLRLPIPRSAHSFTFTTIIFSPLSLCRSLSVNWRLGELSVPRATCWQGLLCALCQCELRRDKAFKMPPRYVIASIVFHNETQISIRSQGAYSNVCLVIESRFNLILVLRRFQFAILAQHARIRSHHSGYWFNSMVLSHLRSGGVRNDPSRRRVGLYSTRSWGPQLTWNLGCTLHNILGNIQNGPKHMIINRMVNDTL